MIRKMPRNIYGIEGCFFETSVEIAQLQKSHLRHIDYFDKAIKGVLV